jgi:NAD(P)-dependent dehydrogenase (short-subunit alcohol dehydrogenase family)
MMNRFKGKIALVTGATSGIGRATALAFAREGAKVVVAGRREKEGEETLHLIHGAGGKGIFVKTDVTIESEVEALIEKIIEAYGRIDCAFNNAGSINLSPIVEQTEAHYESIMDVNVKGVFLCLKHEIPQMLKAGGGAIVNSSSLAGILGSPENSVYSASKHAVLGLTRSTALEAAKSGIRVNAVCGAFIKGAMEDLFMDFKGITEEQSAASIPIGRLGEPEEIARAVLFLCSDDASFITGACLSIDGGYSAQ